MSKERKPRLAQRLQTDRGLYRALQRWGYYLLPLMAWVTVVLAVSALGVLVCSRLTWYETDPLYHLLLWVRDYYFFVCIAVVLLGWVVISWHFISRPVRQLDALIGASAQLTRPTEEPIRLPASMKSVEDQLNLAREEALRAQRAAREAEQRKNDLVVYLAHNIRTPLTSVIGYLDLMKEAPDLPVEQRGKYLSITLDKAYRLEQLINEFFEITRFNLHNIPLTKENIPLSFLLMQLSEEFYPILTPGGKSVHLNVPEDLILPGDPDKLARVFNNILKNAAAYSLPNTVIEIRAWKEAEQIHITFTNQGAQIPKEQLAMMKPNVILINTARGGLINETDLLDALEAGAIYGAGIDAFCEEPPKDHRWFTLDNVVIGSHCAASTVGASRNMGRMATANLLSDLGL